MQFDSTLLFASKFVKRQLSRIGVSLDEDVSIYLELCISNPTALPSIDTVKFERLLSLLGDHTRWECRAFRIIVMRETLSKDGENYQWCVDQFLTDVSCLDDEESRVCMLWAQLCEFFAKKNTTVGNSMNLLDRVEFPGADFLLNRIEGKLVRAELTRPTLLGTVTDIPLDDTSGWRNVEIDIMAFNGLIRVYGLRGLFTRPTLALRACVQLLEIAGQHMNRHIHESALEFIDIIYKSANGHYEVLIESALSGRYANASMKTIAAGLENNWSQLRLAAARSTGIFFTAYSIAPILVESRHHIAPLVTAICSEMNALEYILPRLCMNRFYVADGVKMHAISSWRAMVDTNGKELLSSVIKSAIDYYVDMAKSKSHMVSEAACAALSEVGCRLEIQVVRPHLSTIFSSLLECLASDSWPIRDAASISLSALVEVHSASLKELGYLNNLIDLWLKNVGDHIWSLRANAAKAIGVLLNCSVPEIRSEAVKRTVDHLKLHLDNALRDSMNKNIVFMNSKLEHALTVKSIPKQTHGLKNDLAENGKASNINLRRRGAWGCCLDCEVDKEGTPFDASDGCVYLLVELAKCMEGEASPFIPVLFQLLDTMQYKNADRLHTTIFDQTDNLVKALGTRFAQKLATEYGHVLKSALKKPIPLLQSAAKTAMVTLNDCLKPNC